MRQSRETFSTLLAQHFERFVWAQWATEELLGHRHLETTMIYTQVLNRGAGVKSPTDSL